MSERLELRGRLQEAKAKYDELDALASADITLGRQLLDPWQEDVKKLDTVQIVAVVNRLNATITDMRKVHELIQRITKELGE